MSGHTSSRDKIRYEIRKKVGVTPVEDKMHKLKLRWKTWKRHSSLNGFKKKFGQTNWNGGIQILFYYCFLKGVLSQTWIKENTQKDYY